MKLEKKHIILGIILLAFFIFCIVTLLPHNSNHIMKLNEKEKNVAAVKSKDNDSVDKFENLYSFSIKINDEILQVPTNLSDFINNGWQSTTKIEEDTFSFVPIEHIEFIKNNIPANVIIDSTEVYPLTMDKYYISSILVNEKTYKDYKVELPKNIRLAKSSKDSILKAYGEPDDIWSYEDEPERMFYKYDKNQVIILTLNEKGLLSEIELSYVKEMKRLDFSLVNQEPLTQLSNNLNGDMFKVDGIVYRLPTKVSNLLQQGWETTEEIETLADGADERAIVEFEKDGQMFKSEVRNPDMKPSKLEDCYIVSVMFDLEECNNFEFSAGYNQLSTMEDYRALANEFQVKEVRFGTDLNDIKAYRIKTGNSSQLEVLLGSEDNQKINAVRLSNYPK